MIKEIVPMTPKEIVLELDKYIIGQKNAKHSVAIALRNRWRRMQLDSNMKDEILPKNIIMIGPTGVGKTEISRRLSKLCKAPFIKVEATKFTEVGYVGRDVDSIIRELTDISFKILRKEATKKFNKLAKKMAEKRIINVLLPNSDKFKDKISKSSKVSEKMFKAREKLMKKLREGKLNDRNIEIEIPNVSVGIEIMAPPGMEEMTNQLQNIFQNISSEKKKIRKMKIKDAFRKLYEEESSKLINNEEIKHMTIEYVEQHGIVFIDEIDKIVRKSSQNNSNSQVSCEGVQRDLLPLVEGSVVMTKYGAVKTEHILFIASGSFHLAKPTDLIPELQGRFPVRVELKALTVRDFEKILSETNNSLIQQYIQLLKTENIYLNFTNEGIKRIAEIAWEINESSENIGARRLYTVLEFMLNEVSFKANCKVKNNINIDKKYVNKNLKNFIKNKDLNKYLI